MNAFAQLSDEERRIFFDQTAARLGLPAASIEKDFWVCWTLRILFRLPEWGPALTFKGGTSLLKGWQLIQRFSEDLDVVIDRDHLGFGGDASPEHAGSGKQRKKRLDELRATCQQRIQKQLHPALTEAVNRSLPSAGASSIQLAPPNEDPDQQTLLFQYPSTLATSLAYLRPVVVIELGARSDTEPSAAPIIRPYVAEAFPEIVTDGGFPVRAVEPRRTFYEKAFLLHEETFRPADKPRKRPLARHYYDLWSLIKKGVAAEALADSGLFERVAEHREVFFRQNWVDYATLQHGSIRLVPVESQMPDWERDYKAMREEMFFGDMPSFAELMGVVRDFERKLNSQKTP